MTHSTGNSLVKLTEQSHNLVIDLAYASASNFTGKPIYHRASCYLHEEAVKRLNTAIELLKPLHMKMKIWDAFRPLATQQALFNHMPDPDYVSHPQTGVRPHCRGIAVDLTLLDSFGHELEMGTHFDDFRPLAHHGNDMVSDEAQKNRLLLAGVMSIAGFEPVATEWWHYQLPNASHYPIITESEIPEDFEWPAT